MVKIAFDVDGILRDLMFKLDEVYLKVYPEHACDLKPHNDWDLSIRYPIGKKIYDFLFEQRPYEIFANAPAFPGALKCFNKTKENIGMTGIITSQCSTTVQATFYWLAWNGFRPGFMHIIDIDHRRPGAIGQHVNKFSYKTKADVKDVDVLIDDHTVNLEQWSDSGRLCFCIDRRWNQDYNDKNSNGKRVYSFNELYAELEKL